MERYLKRLIKIGGSFAIVLPKTIAKELTSDYVWVEVKNSEIILREARIK